MKTLKFHKLINDCIRHYGSQRAFAKAVSIGQSTINDWLYKENPQVQTRLLNRLAEKTSIPFKTWVESLDTGDAAAEVKQPMSSSLMRIEELLGKRVGVGQVSAETVSAVDSLMIILEYGDAHIREFIKRAIDMEAVKIRRTLKESSKKRT